MFTLDLERLGAELTRPRRAALLAAAREALADPPGPDAWSRLHAVPWQTLVIRTRVCARIHATTRMRLNAGDAADGRSIREGFRLADLDEHDGDLRTLLPAIRRSALGLPEALRAAGCRAEAGFTRKVSIFPPPEAIPGALATLDAFRRAAPLSDPVWNALLLYLFLLRTHPFPDGNGRTMRLLLSFELRRAGLLGEWVLPLKRVLDANRANEVDRFTRISRLQHDPSRVTAATADALALMAHVVAIAACRASPSARGGGPEGVAHG